MRRTHFNFWEKITFISPHISSAFWLIQLQIKLWFNFSIVTRPFPIVLPPFSNSLKTAPSTMRKVKNEYTQAIVARPQVCSLSFSRTSSSPDPRHLRTRISPWYHLVLFINKVINSCISALSNVHILQKVSFSKEKNSILKTKNIRSTEWKKKLKYMERCEYQKWNQTSMRMRQGKYFLISSRAIHLRAYGRLFPKRVQNFKLVQNVFAKVSTNDHIYIFKVHGVFGNSWQIWTELNFFESRAIML